MIGQHFQYSRFSTSHGVLAQVMWFRVNSYCACIDVLLEFLYSVPLWIWIFSPHISLGDSTVKKGKKKVIFPSLIVIFLSKWHVNDLNVIMFSMWFFSSYGSLLVIHLGRHNLSLVKYSS